VWRATVAILLVGLIVLVWVLSPSERHRRRVAGRLEVGDSVSRVTELLGEPAARCPGSSIHHLAESFPTGWTTAATETAVQALAQQTRERLVYPLSRRRVADCRPHDDQTEVGVDARGHVRWILPIAGKSVVRLPADFAPASPTGGRP
jgi:hypothetical protein